MLFASSRFRPALNAHVYAMRRSPSTIGPVVVLLMALPPNTIALCELRYDRHAGLMIASPAVLPGTGLRHAVWFASPVLTGNVPVTAGDVTWPVSIRIVGVTTARWTSVARIASC